MGGYMVDTLLWKNIESFAKNNFNIWSNDGQFIFAEQAWRAIVDAGLADYTDEIERHRVLIRLMTIATFYGEFCDLVFDEYFCRDEILDWLDDEEMFCSIRIWQIIGERFYKDEKISGNRMIWHDGDDCSKRTYSDYLIEALNEIIDECRDEVFKAMKKGFGGEVELFIALYVTAYTREDGTEYNIHNFTEDDWANFGVEIDDLSFDSDQERGYYWVSIGMPRSPKENV